MSSAFAYLEQLQQRCKNDAVGLPTKSNIVDDWVGIGFKSSEVRCIAQMSEVTEILPMPDLIRVPGVKSWVKGLANVRGLLMPILDLRSYLTGEDTDLNNNSRILVVNKYGVLAGLLVEEVFGLRRFKVGAQKQANLEILRESHMGPYIAGEFVEKDEGWNIFSMQKLLTTEKFLRVV